MTLFQLWPLVCTDCRPTSLELITASGTTTASEQSLCTVRIFSGWLNMVSVHGDNAVCGHLMRGKTPTGSKKLWAVVSCFLTDWFLCSLIIPGFKMSLDTKGLTGQTGGQRWHRPFKWWPSARMIRLWSFKRWGSAVRNRTVFWVQMCLNDTCSCKIEKCFPTSKNFEQNKPGHQFLLSNLPSHVC